MTRRKPILIAGPTASGKSELALRLAERLPGVIINADSMQVYRDLAVLTARPTPEDEERAPHRLYGHVPAAEAYSVARWLADVRAALAEAERAGLTPVIVGGTGLYFKALTEGLAPVPDIPAAVRGRWRERARAESAPALHAELAGRDPVMAARLAPGDTQRIVRALEVIDATGRSLADWQRQTGESVLPAAAAVCLVVERPRADLVARADRRFERMLVDGAVSEVAALLGQALPADMPAMRALGVRPIAGMLAGRIDRRGAIEAGKLETRQYLKRQLTWLRRNMKSWSVVKSTFNCADDASLMQIID